jgi:HPt (histidine-containing phosphotransfer) domain-containing protein
MAFSSAVMLDQSLVLSDQGRKKQPPVFDASVLEQLQLRLPGSNETLAQKTVHMYLKTTPGLLHDLKIAAHNRDQNGLRLGAHTLKSSSAIVGAVALSQLAKQLEHAAREQKALNSEAAIQSLGECFDQTKKALEQHLGQENFPV